MKAVVCTRYGPPEVLRLEELATPVPRKNEVRIRILATAVTSSDCYVRGLRLSLAYRLMARLALGWNGPRQPVLGMVLSGEVDSVGPDARSFEVGERGIRLQSAALRDVCAVRVLAGRRTSGDTTGRPHRSGGRGHSLRWPARALTSCGRPAFGRDNGSSSSGPRVRWARPPCNLLGTSVRR